MNVHVLTRGWIIVFALLGACAPVAPPGRDLSRAEIGQRIAAVLHAPTTRIGSVDLAQDKPLSDVLVAAGIAARHGATWSFTAEGLRESKTCPGRDHIARCFALVQDRFVSVVSTVNQSASLESEPSTIATFSYRALPTTALGKRLASAGVLACGVAPTHHAPWKGAPTLVEGIADVSRAASSEHSADFAYLRDAFCPYTRLHDGVHVVSPLDQHSP